MDKLIPLNKGIHRQPSVGADGELSELVNLIPQNGELVNVRGLERFGAITGELLCTHRIDDDIYYFTLSGDKIHIYDEGLEEKSEYRFYNRIEEAKVSAVAYGRIVAISGLTEENLFCIFSGAEYKFFTLSDLYIETIIKPSGDNVKVDGTEYERRNWETQQQGLNSKPAPKSIYEFYGVTFGVIGLKMYDETYLYYSDVFTLDSPLDSNGIYNAGSFTYYAYGGFQIMLKKRIPKYLSDLLVSVDIYLTDPTLLKDENGKYKDSRDATEEMLGAVFYKVDSILVADIESEDDLTEDNDVYRTTIELKRPNGTGEPLLFGEGAMKTAIGELFGYNSRIYIYAGKQYLPVHRGYHSTHLFNVVEYRSSRGGPYSYPIDSYFYEDGKYTYRTTLVDATILVDVEDESYDENDKISKKTSTLSWSGKVQYPLSPVFTIPTSKAKNFRIYLDLSSVYLLSEKYKDSGEYDKKTYAKFTHEIYSSNLSQYGMSGFVYVSKDTWDYQGTPSDSDFSNIFSGGVCYIQPYRVYIGWSTDQGAISTYRYGDFNGDEVKEDEKKWSFMNKMSYDNLDYIGKTIKEVRFEPNYIRYGNATNPFVFDPLNGVSVGEGRILKLSTSAKALSQGQFGQFPLYAFCTDGIWALEIGSDGTIISVTPVSRDVCNNPDSVTQIDGAVVFTTDQGLMMIQGSEVVNLSGAMEGYNTDESIYFPEGFFDGCGKGEFDRIVVSEKRDFREILRTCTIAYDYANQLLRIFPKREDETDSTHPYKYYVYSFTTREFASVVGSEFEVRNDESVTYNEVETVVPDYPSSIVQIGNALYRPAERDDNENTKKGLLLTRPVTLDEPFALKKLQDMRLHYSKFDGSSKCYVVVYASNDGTYWAPIRSLRKRSYKYYRFAIITEMKDMDALSGMVLRYEVERNNKLR